MATCKILRDISTNHGVEGPALGEHAHVDVDHEQTDGKQRSRGVNQHGRVARVRAFQGKYSGSQSTRPESNSRTPQKTNPQNNNFWPML